MTLRRQELEAVALMIGRMEDEVRYHGSDVGSLVRNMGQASFSERLPFLPACSSRCEAGEPFPDAWRSALEESAGKMHLTQEEHALLLAFGGRLGATDLEGQLDHCALHFKEVNRMLEEARAVHARLRRGDHPFGLSTPDGGVLARPAFIAGPSEALLCALHGGCA